MEPVQQPNPGPYPVLGVHSPSTSAWLQPSPELTDPEPHLDYQSLSTDSQPVDPQATIYAAKGKAKESRRISGTTRDVGNAAQRELQSDERSLDPGE